MDNNWIVDNLENALTTWNEKLAEMWTLLTESPQTFKGGTIWSTVTTINGAMQAIGYGLLVLFFAISIFKSSATFRDFQRPEYVFKHFIYFILAKLGITYGMDLMVNIFDVCNGIVAHCRLKSLRRLRMWASSPAFLCGWSRCWAACSSRYWHSS